VLGIKLPPKEAELYRRVDEVLHYLWDPIGISDEPGARDEYDSHLPRVFKMVNEGAEAADIANYLDIVVKSDMGLKSNGEFSLRIADVLLRWKAWIEQQD
jgi:hypothetical protein